MDKQNYTHLSQALSLLHDFISNYGAKAEHYEILEQAENTLRECINEVN